MNINVNNTNTKYLIFDIDVPDSYIFNLFVSFIISKISEKAEVSSIDQNFYYSKKCLIYPYLDATVYN